MLALAAFAGGGGPLAAQGGPEISGAQITNNFPTHLEFSAILPGGGEVTEAVLFYRVRPEGAVTRAPAEVTAGEIVRFVTDVPTNQGRGYIPAGADIEWQWQVTLSDGLVIETEQRVFRYEDPRYEWLQIQEGNLFIRYYEDEATARRLLSFGAETIEEMSRLLGIEPDFPINLYVWSSVADARGVEHVQSETFEMLIDTLGSRVLADLIHIFAPTQWVVAHELTHVLTHAAGEAGIGRLPAWLDEGTATYAEGDWLNRRGFSLNTAIDRDALLTVRGISSNPGDPAKVELFYAQSAAIVTFLIAEFGEEVFAELFRVIQEGNTTDNALLQVFGFDRDGLEEAFRASVGLAPLVRGEDRSTRIEDELVQVAPAEGATEDAASPSEEVTESTPEDIAVERTDDEIAARRAEIEERQRTRRLPAPFSTGGEFPTDEVVTGVSGGVLILAVLLLWLLLGRTRPGPVPAASEAGPAPPLTLPSSAPMTPEPLASTAPPPESSTEVPGDDGVETLTFPRPDDSEGGTQT